MHQNEIIKQDCPLCGAPASHCLVDFEKCKYFDCPNCSLFQISLRAEKVIRGAPQQWRDSYAQNAKLAPDEYALVIRVPSAPQEPGVASVALSGKFVHRSKLPQ